MKKSFKRFENKKINKPSKVKGGAIGRGTKNTATQSGTKAEML